MGEESAADDAPKLRRELSLKLSVIARQLRSRFDHSMESQGVTRSQWTLIAIVARHPGMTQRTIAEALEIAEASAGRLIDKLCNEGLLARQPHENDRRAYSIVLTDAAKPMIDTLADIARLNEEDAFRGFSDADVRTLGALLERISQNVGGAWEKLPR